MSRNLFVTLIIVFLILTLGIGLYFFKIKTGAPSQAPLSFSGYITSVTNDNKISVDEIEFLSGNEARIKGADDTGCNAAKIEECIPSMNNDFYIRNLDKTLRNYNVLESATIRVMKDPGSPVLTKYHILNLWLLMQIPTCYLINIRLILFLMVTL